MKYCLYQIQNKTTGKYYIGTTNNPTRRWKEHIYRSRKHSPWECRVLSEAIRLYGEDDFEFKILVWGNQEYIGYLEMEAIKAYESYANGYNNSFGGEGQYRYRPWNKGTKGICVANKTSFKKGQFKGQKHHKSKITDKQRMEIYHRCKAGENPKTIADEYGIHWSNIYRAVKFIERKKYESSKN